MSLAGQYILAIALIVIFGIPHGAVDHLIFLQSKRLKFQSVNWISFYSVYLGIIFMIGVLWWLNPLFSFIVFMMISSYHFGQSQLSHLVTSGKKYLGSIIYFLWGTAVLSFFFYSSRDQISTLFENDFFLVYLDGLEIKTLQLTILISFLGLCAAFILLNLKHGVPVSALIMELGILAVILVMFRLLPPFISFSIYFSLWHSARVLFEEYEYLREGKLINSARSFVTKLLPFSAISIVGIAAVLLTASTIGFSISLPTLFLIMISLLTVPHALVMEEMYQSKS